MRTVLRALLLSSFFISNLSLASEQIWDRFSFFGHSKGEAEVLDFDQRLTSIISQPEGNLVHDLLLQLKDNGDIKNIIRRSSNSVQQINPENLVRGEVLLARAEGRDAVFLSCIGCTMARGGNLKLRYLYDGIFMTYKNFEMRFARRGKTWELQTSKGEKIHRLTLVSRTIFGRVVGIGEIQVNK